MAEESSWTSAIVAVEGPAKLVTTQLRLLPSSPQILILPALSTYIASSTTLPSFLDVYDPVQHLRQVHAAIKRRHRDALAFLRRRRRSSSSSNSDANEQRLVFLDGGAASARALCLGALMRHETGGDRAAAEALLRRLTRRGLGGLAQAAEEEEKQQQRAHSAPMLFSVRHLMDDEDEASDPGTRAMRAADALDRQTASLQVSNELDLTTRHHSLSRAASLPVLSANAAGLDTPSTGAAPFYVFGHASSSLDDCTPTTERPRPLPASSPTLDLPRFSIVHYDQNAELPSVFGFDDLSTTDRSFASTAEDGETTPRLRDSTSSTAAAYHRRFASSPVETIFDAVSVRSSVGNVEYGRASLLHMRSATSVRNDGFVGGGVKAALVGGRGRSATHNSTAPKLSRHATAAETGLPEYNNAPAAAARQFAVAAGQSMAPVTKETLLSSSSTGGSSTTTTMTYPLTRVPSTTTRPRTIVVRRTRPVIKLQPVPSTKKRRWQQGKSTYLDDDADVVPTATPPPPADDYQPVFPRMEDLVLLLRSELSPQPVLESALNAMREEYMRKSTCCSSSSSSSTPSSKASSAGSFKSLTDDGTAGLTSPEESCTEADDNEDQDQDTTPKTAVKMTEALPSMDDYDPFAYINPAYGTTTHSSKPSQASVAVVHSPPTPAQTPPPEELVEADSTEVTVVNKQQQPADSEKEAIEELDCGIHEVVVEPKQPPVEVQNSIRRVLYRHYPVASARGYVSSFQFPKPPPPQQPTTSAGNDDDGLWRPLFRLRKTSSLPAVGASGLLLPPTQLKQVLAVGLQNGIKREYAARVISQIERFGTEPTGSARCTRLDFRYLLANTMQSFTSQPLRSQMAEENPFGSPQLLAARLLPHLETYLAMHADIRFLILEYPPEHLATVIALQKLAGVDLVKIAQIVDARSKERLPFRHVRAGSVSSGSSRDDGSGSGGGGSSVYSRRTSSLTGNSLSAAEVEANRAKANFLLTSSASAKDIADFVAAVWNVPVPNRPQTAREAPLAIAPPSLAATDDSDSLPLESLPLELPATSSPPTPETSPVQRKAKPAQLRVNALSAFPKPTGPQSPLTPSASTMQSVLAPPPSATTTTPPTSSRQQYRSSSRTPSPEQHQQQQHVVARVSAVGTSTLHLRRQLSNSTMRTTNSGISALSRASTPHIAYMRKNAPPAPGTPSSRLYNPSIPPSPSILQQPQQQQQQQPEPAYYHEHHLALLPPPPRFLDSSMGGSTLMDDGASSIMTFDPAEDSDYDQEERRLMPFFGKKRRRVRPGTQKALRVLGMMA